MLSQNEQWSGRTNFICSTTVVSFGAFRKRLHTRLRIIRCDWDWNIPVKWNPCVCLIKERMADCFFLWQSAMTRCQAASLKSTNRRQPSYDLSRLTTMMKDDRIRLTCLSQLHLCKHEAAAEASCVRRLQMELRGARALEECWRQSATTLSAGL